MELNRQAGQLHRILESHSLQGIREVLRRLGVQGVVREDTVGNVYAYQLNRDHLAAEHIIGLQFSAADVAARGPREPVLRDVLDEG